MKKSFLLCLFLLPVFCIGQSIDRIEVEGSITVPQGFDADGISIFNKTSNRGTVSSQEGEFTLEMAEGDTLYFSAVQFEALRVEVSREIIDAGTLNVEIFEGVNELHEIIIKSHDLTGVLSEDIKNVEVVYLNLPPNVILEDFQMQSHGTPNAAINEIGGGANHFLLLQKAVKLLFPKRNRKKSKGKQGESISYDNDLLQENLRANYSDDFFETNFNIPPEKINNFLAFCAENGFDPNLLQKNKEMELLQFLVQQSKEYHNLQSN